MWTFTSGPYGYILYFEGLARGGVASHDSVNRRADAAMWKKRATDACERLNMSGVKPGGSRYGEVRKVRKGSRQREGQRR